jgi:hypothetical protein
VAEKDEFWPALLAKFRLVTPGTPVSSWRLAFQAEVEGVGAAPQQPDTDVPGMKAKMMPARLVDTEYQQIR